MEWFTDSVCSILEHTDKDRKNYEFDFQKNDKLLIDMSHDTLSVIASFLGVIVGIIGFVFVWRQIKQVNASIKSNTDNNLYSLTIDINKFLIENPELRPYFYGDASGKEKEYDNKDLNFNKIETLADIYITFFEYIFEERKNMEIDLFNSWEEWKKDMYKKSPAIRKHLKNHSNWYKSDFIESFK